MVQETFLCALTTYTCVPIFMFQLQKNPYGEGFLKISRGRCRGIWPRPRAPPYQIKDHPTLDLCINFHDDTSLLKPSKGQT